MSKIIHQVWLNTEGRPAPKPVEMWRRLAAENGWEHKLWDEAACAAGELFNRRLYEKFIRMGDVCAASQVVRMDVAYQFGGIYLDCEFAPVASTIDNYLPLDKGMFIGVTENNYPAPHCEYSECSLSRLPSAVHLSNGVFYTPVGDPIVEAVVKGMEDTLTYQKMQGAVFSPWGSIGCFYLTNVAKSHPFILLPMYRVYASPEELAYGDKAAFRKDAFCCYVDNKDFSRLSVL